MTKSQQSTNTKNTKQIFEDLEHFLSFCKDHGYRYNEADLYNWKSYAYQQFNKFQQGKSAKDMWDQDKRTRV